MSHRVLLGTLLLLFVLLQYAIWAGKNNVLDLITLNSTLSELREQNKKLRKRNDQLHAEVIDIKSRLSAIEALARSELGLIKPGETFFQIIEKKEEKK